MWLVVGLGNPGPKYERNRHNVGFRVVDELVRARSLPAWKQKLGGESTTGTIAGAKIVALKPMEFMNLSGFAVQRVAKFHGIAVAHVIVVHDEVDLDFGIVRLKSGGGHGGHNGLRSIVEQLGEADFARVRVGIGRDPNKPPGAQGDTAGWVLSDFPAAAASTVTAMISAGCEAVETIVEHGIVAAMNRLNARSKASTA
jgi:PTH1 family peptidyl-tRNA hydrolase